MNTTPYIHNDIRLDIDGAVVLARSVQTEVISKLTFPVTRDSTLFLPVSLATCKPVCSCCAEYNACMIIVIYQIVIFGLCNDVCPLEDISSVCLLEMLFNMLHVFTVFYHLSISLSIIFPKCNEM